MYDVLKVQFQTFWSVFLEKDIIIIIIIIIIEQR